MNYGGMRRKMFRTSACFPTAIVRPMRLPSRHRNDRHAISKKEKGRKERDDRSLDRNFGTLPGSHAEPRCLLHCLPKVRNYSAISRRRVRLGSA